MGRDQTSDSVWVCSDPVAGCRTQISRPLSEPDFCTVQALDCLRRVD